MVNTGGDLGLAIAVTNADGTSTTDCEYREITLDGVYLDKPRWPHLGRTFLAPGYRSDWMIKCSKPGIYKVDVTRKNTKRTCYDWHYRGCFRDDSNSSTSRPT